MVEKLLIVEDQGSIRKMLRIALGYGKYVMHEAETGSEALATFDAQKPNVILLDVILPGELNGFEVCKLIRQRTKNDIYKPYIVIITAKQQDTDIEEGRQSGADAYVVKPFSPVGLIEVIESRAEHAGSMLVIRKPN